MADNDVKLQTETKLGSMPKHLTVVETRQKTKIRKIKTEVTPINGNAQNTAECKNPIQIAVFFDGIGNSMFDDQEKQGLSNIASLYKLHNGVPIDQETDLKEKPKSNSKTNKSTNSYKIYVPGVGANFPLDQFVSQSTDSSSWGMYQLLGAIFGLGGENRLLYVFNKILMILHMEHSGKVDESLKVSNEALFSREGFTLWDSVTGTPAFLRNFLSIVLMPFLSDKKFNQVLEFLNSPKSERLDPYFARLAAKFQSLKKDFVDVQSVAAWMQSVTETMWSEDHFLSQVSEIFKKSNQPKREGSKTSNTQDAELESISCITIDVFGFSRGAAAARAFCGALSILKTKNLMPAMRNIHINFVGLFDTVASVGPAGETLKLNTIRAFIDDRSFSFMEDLELPFLDEIDVPILNDLLYPLSHSRLRYIHRDIREVSAGKDTDKRINLSKLNNDLYSMLGTVQDIESEALAGFHGHYGWASPRLLTISEKVKKCVHLVALHEVRQHFGLTSVMFDKQMPKNCEEIAYVGSHSDIGGGHIPGDVNIKIKGDVYKPGVNGKPSNMMLSNIPGMYMFERGIETGVDFKTASQIKEEGLTDLLAISSEIAEQYKLYLKNNQDKEASVQGNAAEDTKTEAKLAQHYSYIEKHVHHMTQYFNIRLNLMAHPEIKQDLFKLDDKLYLLTTQRQLAHFYSVFQNLEHSNFLKEHFYDNKSTVGNRLVKNPVVHLQTYYSNVIEYTKTNPQHLINRKLKEKFGDARYLMSFNLSSGFSAASLISKAFVSERKTVYSKGKFDAVFLKEAAKRPISYYLNIEPDKTELLPDELFLLNNVHDSVAWFSKLSVGGDSVPESSEDTAVTEIKEESSEDGIFTPIKGFIDTVTSDFLRYRTVYMLSGSGVTSSEQDAELQALYLKNFEFSEQDQEFLISYMQAMTEEYGINKNIYLSYHINGRKELHEIILDKANIESRDLPMDLEGYLWLLDNFTQDVVGNIIQSAVNPQQLGQTPSQPEQTAQLEQLRNTLGDESK